MCKNPNNIGYKFRLNYCSKKGHIPYLFLGKHRVEDNEKDLYHYDNSVAMLRVIVVLNVINYDMFNSRIMFAPAKIDALNS